MTVRAWVDSNLQRGYNLNSDKLKSFASAIDEELGRAGSSVTNLFGRKFKTQYECLPTIISPGGSPLRDMLENNNLFNNWTIGKSRDAWKGVLTTNPRRFSGFYGSYNNDGRLPYYLMYQLCSDGGYNIYHVGVSRKVNFQIIDMNTAPGQDESKRAVFYRGIDNMRYLMGDGEEMTFSIVGKPINQLNLMAAKNTYGFDNELGYNTKPLETTLHAVFTAPAHAIGTESGFIELFLNVQITREDYEPNNAKLRRYMMNILGGYIRKTDVNATNSTKWYKIKMG